MTKRLKRRFFALALACITLILLVVIGGMNLVNYLSVIEKLDQETRILVQRLRGNSQVYDESGSEISPSALQRVRVESRYFKVFMKDAETVTRVARRYNDDITDEEAGEYAMTALAGKKDHGFIGDYRYLYRKGENVTCVVFVYAADKLADCRGFLETSVAVGLVGYLIIILVLWIGVKYVVRPIEIADQKQKRFITDAGHELKTPLSIISVNADLLRMEGVDGDSLDDISYQIQRLNKLVQNLLYLTAMEETENRIETKEVMFSDMVAEAQRIFRVPAKTRHNQILCDIEPDVCLNGNSEALEKLIYNLFDNAIKYAAEDSDIRVTLKTEAKKLIFEVENETDDPADTQGMNELFERFYRGEDSRESTKGGYGLGLSIVKSVVTAHKGTIRAFSPREHVFCITVTLPL